MKVKNAFCLLVSAVFFFSVHGNASAFFSSDEKVKSSGKKAAEQPQKNNTPANIQPTVLQVQPVEKVTVVDPDAGSAVDTVENIRSLKRLKNINNY